MRPLVLYGHERPLTQVKFNAQGDLLFTCAKNPEANIWYTANGERLGSYSKHMGVIWALDVDWTSSYLITGSGDSSVVLWDVETGKDLNTVSAINPVRSVGFSFCGNNFFYTTDEVIQKRCEITMVDKRDSSHMMGKSSVFNIQTPEKEKITVAVSGPNGDDIICGHENGVISKIDARTGEVINRIKPHKGLVTDIQMYSDDTMFITASKDRLSKLIGSYDLDEFITYEADRPINSAAISGHRNFVIIGGGQEAVDVTTTHSSEGGFDARLYHLFYAEEFARIKCHFGPINSVAFTKDGKGFATGGEDGYVRLHTFDDPDLDVKAFGEIKEAMGTAA